MGVLAGEDTGKISNRVYEEIMKCQNNFFLLSSGATDKGFIEDMTKYLKLFASSLSLEASGLQITMIMPSLLLQKHSWHSKVKDHHSRSYYWKEKQFRLATRNQHLSQGIQKRCVLGLCFRATERQRVRYTERQMLFFRGCSTKSRYGVGLRRFPRGHHCDRGHALRQSYAAALC